MLASANSHWLLAVAYLVAALLMFRGLSRESAAGDTWPALWLTSGLVLLGMSAARAGGVSNASSESLHAEAIRGGWYDNRRPLQVVALCLLLALWALAIVLVCRQLSGRRRGYAAIVVTVSGVALFAAVRVISLHRIDGLLQRHEIASARYGTVLEWLLIGAAAACSLIVPRSIDADN